MQAIRDAINTALTKLELPSVDFSVEHPADVAHGDYASNVAMVLAKQVGKNPRELAEEIVAKLDGQIDIVATISLAGPGFINVTLKRDFFSNITKDIIATGSEWGRHERAQGKVILFEYTSPNLFKPLHVGNLVGNIVGESIARLFEAAGATVHRINYPSDIGLTVAKGVWGLKQTGGDPRSIAALGEAYRYGNEMYEAGGPEKDEIIAVNQALYAGSDEILNQLREEGLLTSKISLDSLCAVLGTQFDKVIFESDAAPKGVAIVTANTPSVFTESEGAIVYPGEKIGLHTRVFLNSKGLPTYEAKDLGNFALKQATYPDWTHSIIVTGNEQSEYFKVLYAAIKDVFPEATDKTLEHIATGFLTLTTGKMSSRKGNILSGEQILEELQAAAKAKGVPDDDGDNENAPLAAKVATAAIKYQILRNSVGSNMVFDKEAALSFEGDSGPYLQYTNARINSVLEKAAAVGVQPNTEHAPTEPYALERLLYRWPEVTQAALAERAPHLVARYLTDLAGAFNTFYAQEKIADAADQFAPYKAALAQAVGQTLQNGLWVLGIEAPEKL
jgi:arginyl-tRNA synthetase